jgi:hypothetical protein
MGLVIAQDVAVMEEFSWASWMPALKIVENKVTLSKLH